MTATRIARRNLKALPQVESTVLVEGIAKKIVKCTARKAFTVGNSLIAEGETFFLVASDRRANRYYVVHYSNTRCAYQCSCGANCSEHEHLKTVREHVMNTVVIPAKPDATPMAVPAKAQNRAENGENSLVLDVNTQSTREQWKAIAKADKARQRAWQAEYRAAAKQLEIA
jgi:hypothetical protein